MNDYVPRPIPTAHVEIDGEVEALVEVLARNAHDLWAEQRLRDGWTYGPARCDETRKHPCLVRYDDLPDQEKEYDRIAVRGVVRTILALGFVFRRLESR